LCAALSRGIFSTTVAPAFRGPSSIATQFAGIENRERKQDRPRQLRRNRPRSSNAHLACRPNSLNEKPCGSEFGVTKTTAILPLASMLCKHRCFLIDKQPCPQHQLAADIPATEDGM